MSTKCCCHLTDRVTGESYQIKDSVARAQLGDPTQYKYGDSWTVWELLNQHEDGIATLDENINKIYLHAIEMNGSKSDKNVSCGIHINLFRHDVTAISKEYLWSHPNLARAMAPSFYYGPEGVLPVTSISFYTTSGGLRYLTVVVRKFTSGVFATETITFYPDEYTYNTTVAEV